MLALDARYADDEGYRMVETTHHGELDHAGITEAGLQFGERRVLERAAVVELVCGTEHDGIVTHASGDRGGGLGCGGAHVFRGQPCSFCECGRVDPPLVLGSASRGRSKNKELARARRKLTLCEQPAGQRAHAIPQHRVTRNHAKEGERRNGRPRRHPLGKGGFDFGRVGGFERRDALR